MVYLGELYFNSDFSGFPHGFVESERKSGGVLEICLFDSETECRTAYDHYVGKLKERNERILKLVSDSQAIGLFDVFPAFKEKMLSKIRQIPYLRVVPREGTAQDFFRQFA